LEIADNGWTVKEFQCQFDTSLYERLALSRDKEKVRVIAEKGQAVESPQDLFKDLLLLMDKSDSRLRKNHSIR